MFAGDCHIYLGEQCPWRRQIAGVLHVRTISVERETAGDLDC
jgi:hypothetical protein